jgi:flagellar L-ring protein precursor FlgH
MSKAILLLCVLLWPLTASDPAKELTPLERYIIEATARGNSPGASPGAIWSPVAPLAEPGRDLRARFIDDLITIVVAERASAVASGNVKSARTSSAKASINALGGVTRSLGRWVNPLDISSDTQLDGQATTSRQTELTTSMSARVTRVLPNGYLVVEGIKEIQLNSERQTVTVRGVARPADLLPGNVVQSDRLAQLEVRINGKGVVGDAVRRPFFLYRLLLGLLPF